MPVNTLATENVTEAVTQAPEAQAQTPETKVPETAAPETQAQTQAPETKVPETEAPETQTPETQAQTTVDPAETGNATDQPSDAASTETPAQTEITTSSEETAETDTNLSTEAERETETETAEEEYATSFSVTSDNVTVTAVTTDAAKFPKGTQMHVDRMMEGTQAYKEAIAAVKASLNLAEDEEFAAGPMYDIYFMVDGQRVEPDASVKVSITFTSPVKTETVADSNIQSAGVYHVDDNGAAEKVSNDIQVTGEGEVTRMGFTSAEFSPYVGGLVLKTANQGNSTSVDISNMVSGVKITSPNPDDKGVYHLKKGSDYNVELSFAED